MATTQNDLAALIVARLLAHPSTSALVDTRVYGPADAIPDPATYPLLVVTHGTNHGAPEQAGPALSAADEVIEARVAPVGTPPYTPPQIATEVAPLTTAVQAALSGYKSGVLVQCLVVNTATPTDETDYWSRKDTFQTFFKG